MPQRSFALTILAISRAYSIGYVSSAGLAAALIVQPRLSSAVIVGLLAIPTCLTVGLAAINDAIHAAADARAGRGRDYPPGLLLALGGGATLAALLGAWWGGLWVLTGIAGTVIGGVVYALLKDRPGLGNLARGATSVPLVVGLGALAAAPSAETVLLALACGVLDAAGNLYGDVRDAQYDRRAGVMTLVVLYPRSAMLLALALHGIAVLMLQTLTGPWVLLTLVGLVWVRSRPDWWQHRAFLMLKYVTVLGVAYQAAATPHAVATVWAFLPLMGVAWVIYTAVHNHEKG